MFCCKVDNDTELRLLEPRHAEALDTLIERIFDNLKKWSAWLKDDRSINNTHVFIKGNLKQFADNAGFAVAVLICRK